MYRLIPVAAFAVLFIPAGCSSSGNLTQIAVDTAHDQAPDISLDGTTIVYCSWDGSDDEIWRMNSDGTDVTRVTNDAGTDQDPDWSNDDTKIIFESGRDGDFVAFRSDRGGSPDIYIMRSDGSDQTSLTSNPADDRVSSWGQ